MRVEESLGSAWPDYPTPMLARLVGQPGEAVKSRSRMIGKLYRYRKCAAITSARDVFSGTVVSNKSITLVISAKLPREEG